MKNMAEFKCNICFEEKAVHFHNCGCVYCEKCSSNAISTNLRSQNCQACGRIFDTRIDMQSKNQVKKNGIENYVSQPEHLFTKFMDGLKFQLKQKDREIEYLRNKCEKAPRSHSADISPSDAPDGDNDPDEGSAAMFNSKKTPKHPQMHLPQHLSKSAIPHRSFKQASEFGGSNKGHTIHSSSRNKSESLDRENISPIIPFNVRREQPSTSNFGICKEVHTLNREPTGYKNKKVPPTPFYLRRAGMHKNEGEEDNREFEDSDGEDKKKVGDHFPKFSSGSTMDSMLWSKDRNQLRDFSPNQYCNFDKLERRERVKERLYNNMNYRERKENERETYRNNSHGVIPNQLEIQRGSRTVIRNSGLVGQGQRRKGSALKANVKSFPFREFSMDKQYPSFGGVSGNLPPNRNSPYLKRNKY